MHGLRLEDFVKLCQSFARSACNEKLRCEIGKFVSRLLMPRLSHGISEYRIRTVARLFLPYNFVLVSFYNIPSFFVNRLFISYSIRV